MERPSASRDDAERAGALFAEALVMASPGAFAWPVVALRWFIAGLRGEGMASPVIARAAAAMVAPGSDDPLVVGATRVLQAANAFSSAGYSEAAAVLRPYEAWLPAAAARARRYDTAATAAPDGFGVVYAGELAVVLVFGGREDLAGPLLEGAFGEDPLREGFLAEARRACASLAGGATAAGADADVPR